MNQNNKQANFTLTNQKDNPDKRKTATSRSSKQAKKAKENGEQPRINEYTTYDDDKYSAPKHK